ncbi:MAG: DUF3488 and transglutaminase-like domain-containing protein [Actinomycetota bacterium]|nr:DUF3488 and transglutaminase-like domain-containing protein [Actinomycetota bacterium]
MSVLRLDMRAAGADPAVVSAAALTSVSLAAAVGMGRLFQDGSYLGALVLAALVTHGLAWWARRRGVSLPITAVMTVAVLGVVTTWVVLPGATWNGIPTPATLETALRELREARTLFAVVVAPAPVTPGFLMAAMFGVAVAAFLADWAAFRLELLFEALLPSLFLVVFTALLGGERHRAALVLLYLVTVAVFMLVHPVWLQRLNTPWLADRSAGELGWRLPTGAVLGGAGLMVALLVGTTFAGSHGPSDLWRGRSDDRQSTVSPLVDIRGRLVNPSGDEVFTVRSGVASYWRLTSLDTFDGRIWSSDARHVAVAGRLPPGPGPEPAGERVVQEFTITSLSSPWLPAAYRPRRVEGVEGLRYNDRLDSLVGDERTRRGLTYRVASSVPRPRAADLRRAGTGVASLPEPDRFLRLPSVSPRVRQLASQVTAPAGRPSSPQPSAYERALALQNFFRQRFTYDLGARPGHDERALEGFLFGDRRGYCEQFAGAYAVLARAVGLPARVAVGYTPGELGPDGLYRVRDLNAHAWPEVYIEGAGWVAFEPTPGRGAPGASYTGVAEAQAQPSEPDTAATAAPGTTAPAPPTTAPPSPGEEAAADASKAGGGSALSPGLKRLVLAAAPVVLMALMALAVPLVKRARRRRRRLAAATAGDRVLVAWAEAAESLAQAGTSRLAHETLDEHARRATTSVGLPPPAAAALTDLAEAAATASYRAEPVGAHVATRATSAAATVERALVEDASRAERLRRAMDPRPLMTRGPERRSRSVLARRWRQDWRQD